MAFSEAEKKDRQGSLFTCGYLIHNKEVVKKLESMSVTMIESLDESSEGDSNQIQQSQDPMYRFMDTQEQEASSFTKYDNQKPYLE